MEKLPFVSAVVVFPQILMVAPLALDPNDPETVYWLRVQATEVVEPAGLEYPAAQAVLIPFVQ